MALPPATHISAASNVAQPQDPTVHAQQRPNHTAPRQQANKANTAQTPAPTSTHTQLPLSPCMEWFLVKVVSLRAMGHKATTSTPCCHAL